ncbi:hypothetical protein EGW08_023825, partial [Elysia chlorotica]
MVSTGQRTEDLSPAASETIPRGARKNYRPYWTEELQGLEDEMSTTRQEVEDNPSPKTNDAYKAACDTYKTAYTQAARKNWMEKTESLNLDRSGHKLWKLARAMNDETVRPAQIVIDHQQNTLTGQKAANCFVDNYAQVSSVDVPKEHNDWIRRELRNLKRDESPETIMNKPFNEKEMKEALNTLPQKKSPGPDKITNEMLKNLGRKANNKLL